MEQLSVAMTNEVEKVYMMLKELMCTEREFQIMISVPPTKTDNTKKVIGQNSEEWCIRQDLRKDVTRIIHELGIPVHIKGHQYLREAIILSVSEPEIISSVTKQLYPAIAKQFHTTTSRVERAMRHAIEVAWNKGNVEMLDMVFGYAGGAGKSRPTNSEFIALIADKMRLYNQQAENT